MVRYQLRRDKGRKGGDSRIACERSSIQREADPLRAQFRKMQKGRWVGEKSVVKRGPVKIFITGIKIANMNIDRCLSTASGEMRHRRVCKKEVDMTRKALQVGHQLGGRQTARRTGAFYVDTVSTVFIKPSKTGANGGTRGVRNREGGRAARKAVAGDRRQPFCAELYKSLKEGVCQKTGGETKL